MFTRFVLAKADASQVRSVMRRLIDGRTTWRKRAAIAAAWIATVTYVLPGIADDEINDDDYPRVTLSESKGGQLALADAQGTVATVIVSLAIDCPISNEYLPTLNRLAEKYKPLGVAFIGLNPRADQVLADMADYARRMKLTFPFVRDSDVRLTRRLQFKVTPETCLFDRSGKLVYRGRIDDRYRAGSGAAGTVAKAELAAAIDAVIAGKPPAVARTRPIGCPIP